ncbi:MAG TPA: cobalamin-dependent protein [Mycobacteriales bacterium]|nr:cobalamin-dependent protein [Mycobacteriales bacterium]
MKLMTATSRPAAPGGGLDVIVTSVSSDAHTWNLVYLQLLLEEYGHRVVNLGACVPDRLLVAECLRLRPDLVVMSSVNGHGWRDGRRAITALRTRAELAATPVVIGGKLGIAGPGGDAQARSLALAGFDGVFEDGSSAAAFREFLSRLRPRVSA